MSHLKNTYLKFVREQETSKNIFHNKLEQLEKYHLPICKNIFKKYYSSNKPLFIGLSGGQGSGKSTISKIFQIILQIEFKLKVVCFSIDDFYKTSF